MKKTLESRIAEIESRNARVQNDKAWETSFTRKATIALMTYFIIGFYIGFLGNEFWYLHALVPTCGYLLSTLALPMMRNMWEQIK
ncbi:hypothetical protein KA071_02540 [Candidatus Gracilibacteria bacterium]|nr:hypothetical protein [Candidatus Gracilibacteria bacterium]